MADAERSMNQSHRSSKEADLEHLSRRCLPGRTVRSDKWTLRPERPEYAKLTQSQPNSRWEHAIKHLRVRASICRRGISVDEFFGQWATGWCPNDEDLRAALPAVAAVLYEQDFEIGSPNAQPEPEASAMATMTPSVEILHLSGLVSFLIEHMLLIDYRLPTPPMKGPPMLPRWVYMRYLFPSIIEFCRQLVSCADQCRTSHVPDKEVWDYIGRRLDCFRSCDKADLAIMLFHFHTHRRELSRAEYEKGMTGYTGVLQEIISEIPRTGPDRLIRKLSVDVNQLSRNIPNPQRRRQVIMAAEAIAAEHGVTIYSPASRSEAAPSSDVFCRDRSSVQDGKRWRDFFCGWKSKTPASENSVLADKKND